MNETIIKFWKYVLIFILCFTTFISFVLWSSWYTSRSQIVNNGEKSQVNSGLGTLDEKISSSTDSVSLDQLASSTTGSQKVLYDVVKVVDGDTLDILIDGKIQRLRLIGINTPETVDPRKPVECFGIEASNKAKSVLTGKNVYLESDSTQGEYDKYDRLLRYVFLENGSNFNLLMIREGYAYEYTYDIPYKYQLEFKNAQKEASATKAGLWGDVCQEKIVAPTTTPEPTPPSNNQNPCTIKGNISSSKEKIYHVIGCGSYNQTIIDESKGERWFCSEQEALNAGWRKALNCR